MKLFADIDDVAFNMHRAGPGRRKLFTMAGNHRAFLDVFPVRYLNVPTSQIVLFVGFRADRDSVAFNMHRTGHRRF